MKKDKNNRGRRVSGSCAHAGRNTAEGIDAQLYGIFKRQERLMIYEKYPKLKYKYQNREFWCRRYYVDTVGKNAKKIEEYIQKQLEEDKAGEQLTMGNF